ncbi:CHRD domain-containing protein [Spirosoma montaniterrae]|uniref:CHRD domain-containing protein n=1 Tax=Spirosoma montaniterrae TaxID=1178516 RepID=A0A1P9WTV0_9BACT|nr:CHRD domain-containing protein [Spirosoma montaniterrae]AQG78802.1 hypothetical protein AWR27_05355 [Spirosoma montaniterrae]
MTHRFTLPVIALLALLCFIFVSCNDHQAFPPDARIALVATLSGAAERPTSVVSPGTGQFAGVIDPTTRVLSYTVVYSGITPTMGHLHRITPNSAIGNGPVEIPFASLTSPIIGSATLTTNGRVDSLLNGFYYVNLHTTANPAGEIRGDIRP